MMPARSRLAARLALVLCMAAVPGARAAAADEAPPRPHIVFLLADDLGSHDVGWRGSEIPTPHLDRLAAAGAKLELFNLAKDPGETRNLAAEQPDRVKALLERDAFWAAQAVPPKAGPKPRDFRSPRVCGPPD